MKDCREKLTAIMYQFFPDQVKVYNVGSLDEKKSSDSMLHQHFFEPLSEGNLQELAIQIAGFLNNQDKEEVYSYFWRNSKTIDLDAKWYLSSARLKKNSDETLNKIVVFTYDLELLVDCKAKIYQVIEELDFLKKNYGKASLLTKREIEIILLLAEGKTSIEIGNVLFISNHTVNAHRKNIYKKLEIKTLADLMKYASVFDLTTNQTQLYEN